MTDVGGARVPTPGRVRGIWVAPSAGRPMESRKVVEVRPGRGIGEDRYPHGPGHWSSHRCDDLTLVAAEDVEAAAADLGAVLEPRLLRRNLVTEGLDPSSLLGRRFRVGTAEVMGVRPCRPCMYLEELLGLPGLRGALSGRGGLRVSVLTPGIIRVGDAVVPEATRHRR